jgi:hypothetical protein
VATSNPPCAKPADSDQPARGRCSRAHADQNVQPPSDACIELIPFACSTTRGGKFADAAADRADSAEASPMPEG